MSQQKDIFFQLFTPTLERLGYVFKKSKGHFIKTIGDLDYLINFSWDGRGGATHLDSVSGQISMPSIKKASKKIIGREWDIWYWINYKHHDDRIPRMYSDEMAILFRDVNLRKMAEMPFEQKYPFEKIEKMADVAERIITNEIIPELDKITSAHQILAIKIEAIKNRIAQNDLHNFLYLVFTVKLLCKKLNLEVPDFIKEINLSSNQTVDSQWNMQDYDFEGIEEKILNYKW